VVTHRRLAFVGSRLDHLKLMAALFNPDSQLGEVFEGQLLDGLLDFLNLARGRKVTSFHGKTRPHYWLSLPMESNNCSSKKLMAGVHCGAKRNF